MTLTSTAATILEDDLDGLFTGPLAFCRGWLLTAAPPSPGMPAGDLLDRSVFDGVIDRYARDFPGADRRAVISLWSQYYFAVLLIPALVIGLSRDCHLPLSLADMDVVLDEEKGQPSAFVLRQPRKAHQAGDVFGQWHSLLHHHLDPLIRALRRHGGLSGRLLWENAGGYLAWILSEVEASQPELAAKGWPLMRAGTWPDGRRNPLADTIATIGADGTLCRRRRVCCLRYQLPGFEHCEGLCPLLEKPPVPAEKRLTETSA